MARNSRLAAEFVRRKQERKLLDSSMKTSRSKAQSVPAGWNYTVRLYRPRPEILNGSWKFPEAEPVSGTQSASREKPAA